MTKKNKNPEDKITQKDKARKEGKPAKGRWRENIEALVIAIALALFIRAFIVEPFKIPSGSMKETLLVGDQIFVNKFIFGIRLPFTNQILIPISKPERFDIVVFKYPPDPKVNFIKRVIGLPGETLQIKGRTIYINGKALEDPFGDWKKTPSGKTNKITEPVVVPKGEYFVMGDNRNNSHDSRFWGTVPFSALRGEAFMIYWSWNKGRFGVRWSRIGDWLY